MSAASSEGDGYEYESEPDSPRIPTARPWKYLEHPDDDEWMRGPSETQTWPNLGDFVVLSLDPVASVRHLDAAAQDAARQIPVRHFVAAAIETVGLPVKEKVLHPFDYLFVRQGKPLPRLSGRNQDDACVAILPNDTLVGQREPIRPAHPLPWSDCYFDLTWGFPFECRSSNIERDYFPVLPMEDDELVRVQGYAQEGFAYVRERFGADRPDPLSFVDASIDTVPTLTNEIASPRASSPSHGEPNPAMAAEQAGGLGDNVSIIGSEDHADADGRSVSDSVSNADSEELDMMLRFEAMMKDQGDLGDPVVDTQYDLDMVNEILDPILFLQDVKRLKVIMDDAESRLRAHADLMTTGHVSVNGSLENDRSAKGSSGDTPSRTHIAAFPKEASSLASPPVASTKILAQSGSPKPSSTGKSWRSQWKSLPTKLTYFAKKHVRRLLHPRASDANTGSSVS